MKDYGTELAGVAVGEVKQSVVAGCMDVIIDKKKASLLAILFANSFCIPIIIIFTIRRIYGGTC